MKNLLLMMFAMLLLPTALFARDIEYKAILDFTAEDLNQIPEASRRPWKLNRIILQDKELSPKDECVTEGLTVTCTGVAEDVEFFNYVGFKIYFEGETGFRQRGRLRLSFKVDGMAYRSQELTYFTDTMTSPAIRINNILKSDLRESFPFEPGKLTYTYQDGPIIGPTIQHNRDRSGYLYAGIPGTLNKKAAINSVCVETHDEVCVAYQIVATLDGKRLRLNSTTFRPNQSSQNQDSARAMKKELGLQGDVMLPTSSYVSGGLCVPVLLPVSLPIDFVLLPVTFPIALLKRNHLRDTFINFFDIGRNDVMKVGTNNFRLLMQTFSQVKAP